LAFPGSRSDTLFILVDFHPPSVVSGGVDSPVQTVLVKSIKSLLKPVQLADGDVAARSRAACSVRSLVKEFGLQPIDDFPGAITAHSTVRQSHQ